MKNKIFAVLMLMISFSAYAQEKQPLKPTIRNGKCV